MAERTLVEWLAYLENLHPKTIELGLARVAQVRDALGLDFGVPVVTVGGTNGKGSTCAMLEAILTEAGYRVGVYASPHLLRYNERVRVDGREATDDDLCRAFDAVEVARGDISLTYFEYGTLAAFWLFQRQAVDVLVLEVGLGGRLDAVNCLDADCAIITGVDLDHMQYLGPDREAIGYEKAGIFRQGCMAICADASPPSSLLTHVLAIQADLRRIGVDFGYHERGEGWRFWQANGWQMDLPWPGLRGAYQLSNASACLAALHALRHRLPVTPQQIRAGLLSARVPGRFQVLMRKPVAILDVAHNPQAARALAENLRAMPVPGKTLAVFAMLADKDIPGVIKALERQVDLWLVAPIQQPRGASARVLSESLRQAGVIHFRMFESVAAAWSHACQIAGDGDRIAAFGSFHTVAEVMLQEEIGSNGQ